MVLHFYDYYVHLRLPHSIQVTFTQRMRLTKAVVAQRMSEMAQRPFRKIRVKDHLLGPLGRGERPSVLHCLQASRIVADELTVRLGRRCSEIEKLPNGVGQLPYAQSVISWYSETCRELFEFTDDLEAQRKQLFKNSGSASSSVLGDFFGFLEAPSRRGGYSSLFPSFGGGGTSPTTTSNNQIVPDIKNLTQDQLAPKSEDLNNVLFGTECRDPILAHSAQTHVNRLFNILERAVQRHKPIVLLTAKEISKLEKEMALDPQVVQGFLSKFHHQRIAVRLLIGHCVALSRPLPLDNMIGIFCTKTPVEEIVLESVALAEEMSILTYGCCPPVELSCTPSSATIDLLYIPSHLQHIIFELVKNSMRAVIEKEQERVGSDGIVNTASLPPIIIHWDINEKVWMNLGILKIAYEYLYYF